jgi:hypothetical protein
MRLVSTSLAALSATFAATAFAGGWGPWQFHRDPSAFQMFPPTLSQYESGAQTHESTVDGLDAEFQGSLAGATAKLKTDPAYLSMMGKYDAAKKRYAADKIKFADLDKWAQGVKDDPTSADLARLRSEGQALTTDMQNVGVTLRLLPGELTRIQNAQQWRKVSTR